MFASKKQLAVTAFAVLVGCNVFAAGFEKAELWSGHYGGLGGAGTSDVSGAEGLYFNPAGIGMDHAGSQVQVDISPTFINSSVTINGLGKHNSKDEFLPPYALIYDYTLNDKWGFAIGSYTGGGLADEYNDINFGAGNTLFKTSLIGYEFAAGVSYKVCPKFKLGAEFREVYTTAEFDSNNGTFQQNIKSLDAWSSTYRVGAMWTDAGWGAGVSFRGPADIDLKGKTDIAAAGVKDADTHIKSQLPLELSVGGHYDIGAYWRAYLEYAWTHYSHDKTLSINVSNPLIGQEDQDLSWSDQHQIRVAGEWHKMLMPVRFGYVYTTRVENKSTQVPNFAPPAGGHTFTVGTGYTFGHWQADGAFEYSFSHATGIEAFNGGEEKADVYAVHLGLAYNF